MIANAVRSWVSLGTIPMALLCVLGAGGCNREEAVAPLSPSATVTDEAATESQPSEEAGTPDPSDEAAEGTQINPPQSATLTAQDADAQITVRSQPTINSADQGYGLVGDTVNLLRFTPGEDGFTWYYVRFQDSEVAGWVRGDFVDPTAAVLENPQQSAATEDALGEALDAVCGGPENLNTYYNTEAYNVYICDSPNGLIYVGNEKGSNDTLVARDVTATGTGFIARSGDYRYEIDRETLQVFQGANPDPILADPVESSERY